MISVELNPKPNLIFQEIRKLFDKSFSFDDSSLPNLNDYFYLEGLVTNSSGSPVAGAIVVVSFNGNHYTTVTTLADGTFRFKLPVLYEDTIQIDLNSVYGSLTMYYNYYDILVIAWIYAEQYLQVLQHLAQSKQDSYSPQKVGDVIQPLFKTDKDTYTTLERTLKRRFPLWPFPYLNLTPKYDHLSKLRYWHWHSTFYTGLLGLKDAIGADSIFLIPYDEYLLLFIDVKVDKVASNQISIDSHYFRVARRNVYIPSTILTVTGSARDIYMVVNLQNLSYELLDDSLPVKSLNLIGTSHFKTEQGDFAEFEDWTYAVPNYNVYRPSKINSITPPWTGTLPNAKFSKDFLDEIQLRVARYWTGYNYDIDATTTYLILGALRWDGSNITNIWTYANLIDYNKLDSIQFPAEGEIYIVKDSGWTEDEIVFLGKAIESGNLATRFFYTMFNQDSISSILPDQSYKYLDKKWGGILKGFQNWRNI